MMRHTPRGSGRISALVPIVAMVGSTRRGFIHLRRCKRTWAISCMTGMISEKIVSASGLPKSAESAARIILLAPIDRGPKRLERGQPLAQARTPPCGVPCLPSGCRRRRRSCRAGSSSSSWQQWLLSM